MMTSSPWLDSPRLAADLHGEEGRAFLQRRVALFAKTCGYVSLGFSVATSILLSLAPWHSWQTCWDRQLWLLVATLVFWCMWLVTRRGARSKSMLAAVDAGGSLLALAAYALMTTGGQNHLLTRMDLELMVVAIVLVMLRAVVIPCTAMHTAFVTVLAMLPVIGVSVYVAAQSSSDPMAPPPLVSAVLSGLWTAAVVSMTVLISRVIYRLRAKVRAAQRLGQYVLKEKIGEGGMGSVYRAQHALLRRPTAIKLILPERVGKTAIARFEREVQLTAMLTHPNTVSVYDYGHTPDGIFYYAMEYLDGIDLELLVSTFGAQPAPRVVHILEQVCGALAEAHEEGMVHRDVKPANIILCERGHLLDTAKMVDFGLVKEVAGASTPPGLSHSDSITGTPLYLAPEALLAPETIDARSDLYALGGVAYYLLTGTTVFRGASVMEICAQHLHASPPAMSQRTDHAVPEALERIVMRCLAKDRDDRPLSAASLRAELLALGLPTWSQAQAIEWWRENSAKIPRREARRSENSPVSSKVLVDLAARQVSR